MGDIMELNPHLDARAIHDLIDGELDPAAERAALAHLWRCESCREARDERAAVVTALRWYAAAPPPPPAGYWSDFWRRWRGAEAPVPARSWLRSAPLAAAAAGAALVAGGWWGATLLDPAAAPVATAVRSPATIQPMTDADLDLIRDYEFFERVTVAVGSVDPMSKGVALAGLGGAR